MIGRGWWIAKEREAEGVSKGDMYRNKKFPRHIYLAPKRDSLTNHPPTASDGLDELMVRLNGFDAFPARAVDGEVNGVAEAGFLPPKRPVFGGHFCVEFEFYAA